MAVDGPRARGHRGTGRGHPDASESLGGVGARLGIHRSTGRLQEVQESVSRRRSPDQGNPRSARRTVSRLWQQRDAHGAAAVQSHVQDLHGSRRGSSRGDLYAAGDRTGHLRELSERAAVVTAENSIRHRANRQGVPQRDHARQLHFPHARIRADGDAVFREARQRKRVVRVLALRATEMGGSVGHPVREAALASARER